MINMNNVPNDILGVTKLLKRIFSHTIHWSHKNQAWYVLKQWKTHEMLHLFHSHVSHVSWSCCRVLTNHVSLKCVVYVALWVLHPIHFINKHTWYMTICYNVSRACFMQYELIMDEWCSCLWNASAIVEAKHLGCDITTLQPKFFQTYVLKIEFSSFFPNTKFVGHFLQVTLFLWNHFLSPPFHNLLTLYFLHGLQTCQPFRKLWTLCSLHVFN